MKTEHQRKGRKGNAMDAMVSQPLRGLRVLGMSFTSFALKI
jgi:stalled ribosome alternative rescue factor ArfA